MSTLSARLEQRLGNSMGMVLTVAVHVVVLLLLLDSKETIPVATSPLAARIISESASDTEDTAVIETRPVLDRPQLHVPQPELVIAEVAPTGTAPAAIAASPPAAARTATQSVRQTQPRFDVDYLNNPAPEYPRVSRRLREQGVVMLRVFVLPTGLPEMVELKTSSGSPRLDESALAAVRKWKFVPAQASGQAVAAWVIVPIEFSLSA